MNFRISTFAIIATAFLGGCKADISADLFTSDLINAVNGAALTAPIIIGLEAGSEAKCAETAPAMAKAMATQLGAVDFIGCEKARFDVLARFRVQANVVAMTSEAVTNAPFEIGVQHNGAEYDIFYLTNPNAVRAIWDALPEDMTKYQTFKLEMRLAATLTNDLPDTVEITTDDVFVDGVPVQGTFTRDLPRRDQVELKTSNVTNAAFSTEGGASHIVRFKTIK